MSQAEGGPPEFSITPKTPSGPGTSYGRRKRRRSPMDLVAPVLILAVLVAGGLVAYFLLQPPSEPEVTFRLKPIANKTVSEGEVLTVDAVAEAVGLQGNAVYWLLEAPDGASIETDTGRFTWQPTESHGSGQYGVTIAAAMETAKAAQAEARFVISVTEDRRPPTFEAIAPQKVKVGEPMTVELAATDPDEPASRIRYQLGSGAPSGARLDPNTGLFVWTPGEADGGKTHEIVIEATEGGEEGQSSQITMRVAVAPPSKAESAPKPAMVEKKAEEEKPVEVVKSPGEHGNETILELQEKRKLFHPSSYKTLRKIFAERFKMVHGEVIRAAWGEDEKAITEWFAKHADIKEEFYMALEPEVDDIETALKLFHEMWKLSPARLAEYGNLAIAVAVTWDKEVGPYEYKIHQRGTLSEMPEDLVGAIDNYKYMVRAEQVMQGRGRFLPWEFLVHVVNHKTPLIEREWAVKRFLPERAMIGKCYSKVPYDREMASTQGAVTKLEGQAYNLPNVLGFGGVSAQRADFASRVGKCLGVPAAYVSTENETGGLHAWVTWIELQSVTAKGFAFTIEAHDRSQWDRHYYVGNLKDSKTGQPITDRQFAMRLQTIGMNPVAKRHSDLIMAVYPMLRDHFKMEAGDQLAFLGEVFQLCAGNEAAWHAVAAVSRDGLVGEEDAKTMAEIVKGLFLTFAAFPDFTWEVFDDLIAYEEELEKQALLYGQLMEFYARAGRPDLLCTARLKFTDYLVENEHTKEAMQGLATSVMRVAAEGRYVELMLDRMEELCGEYEGGENDVMNFYRQFLPRVSPKRGDSPSRHCAEMYQRAAGVFREHGQETVAQQIEMQLAALRGG